MNLLNHINPGPVSKHEYVNEAVSSLARNLGKNHTLKSARLPPAVPSRYSHTVDEKAIVQDYAIRVPSYIEINIRRRWKTKLEITIW